MSMHIPAHIVTNMVKLNNCNGVFPKTVALLVSLINNNIEVIAMMNEKMEKVAQTIEKVMRAVFSEEFLEL